MLKILLVSYKLKRSSNHKSLNRYNKRYDTTCWRFYQFPVSFNVVQITNLTQLINQGELESSDKSLNRYNQRSDILTKSVVCVIFALFFDLSI